MGCSTSKESASPGNKSHKTCYAVLSNGLALPTTKSFKSTDADYIEAILSASYGILKTDAGTVKALRTDNWLFENQDQREVANKTGRYLCNDSLTSTTSTAVEGVRTFHTSLQDLRASDGKFNYEVTEAEVRRFTEDTAALERPEIIYTWQLMQGLDDDDEPDSSKNFALASHSAACEAASASLFSMKPQGKAQQKLVSVLAKSIEFAPNCTEAPPPLQSALQSTPTLDKRPQDQARFNSFTSVGSVEGVDGVSIHAGCRNIKSTPPMWDRAWTDLGQQGVANLSPSNFHQISLDTPNLDFKKKTRTRSSECSDLRNVGSESILPFKARRDNCYGQNDRSLIASQNSDPTMNSSSDAVTLGNRSVEVECPTSISSLEFSTVASLKDWLLSSGPLLQSVNDLQQTTDLADYDEITLPDSEGSSFLELRRRQSQHTATDLYNHLKTVRSLAFTKLRSGVDQIFPNGMKNDVPCHEADESAKNVDECTPYIFDPELLESLEKATEQLSDDEWCALRGLEEESVNLADCLHLANSVRTNGSDSVKAAKTILGNETATFAIPIAGNNVVEENFTAAVHSRSLDGNRNEQLANKRNAISHHKSGKFQKGAGHDEEKALLFYSTSSQGNAQVFEDCNFIRTILNSLGICFDERNLYLHPEYEQELRNLLQMPAVVPSVSLNGRIFAGVNNILNLHTKGGLGSMCMVNPSVFAEDAEI